MAQVNIFLKAIGEIEKRKMLWETMVIRTPNLENKDFEAWVKKIEGKK